MFAALDFIHPEIVFERVVTADVVIVLILGSPDKSAATIDIAGDGLELDGQVDVLVTRSIDQRDVECRILAPVLLVQDMVFTVFDHFPLPDGAAKTFGDRAG